MNMKLIEINQVTKKYDMPTSNNVIILDDINLIIVEGEFVSILGPSGSGKSTLLRIIAGLVNPSQGTVLYQGKPIIGTNPGAKRFFS
jgi:NitT/TauT family transport system ATP-binding protein